MPLKLIIPLKSIQFSLTTCSLLERKRFHAFVKSINSSQDLNPFGHVHFLPLTHDLIQLILDMKHLSMFI